MVKRTGGLEETRFVINGTATTGIHTYGNTLSLCDALPSFGKLRDVVPRFGGKRLAGAQRALVACRSGIVGGEQSGIAEAVIHGAQIGRTRKDIVARII